MTIACRVGLIAYGVVSLVALAVAIIGTRGLFGVPPDGLAAVWLIFAGLPLSLPTSLSALIGVPADLAMALTALTPLVNIGVIWWLCRAKPV